MMADKKIRPALTPIRACAREALTPALSGQANGTGKNSALFLHARIVRLLSDRQRIERIYENHPLFQEKGGRKTAKFTPVHFP